MSTPHRYQNDNDPIPPTLYLVLGIMFAIVLVVVALAGTGAYYALHLLGYLVHLLLG